MTMRPGFVLLVVASCCLNGCSQHNRQSKPPDERIVFPRKSFFNGVQPGPQIVYIAGALTGSNVGYKNNYTAITCYEDRRECVITTVDQIGDNQIGRVDMPDFLPITKWDKDIVVASEQRFGCRSFTITIMRSAETALWHEAPTNSANPECKNSSKEEMKWTVEDPPSTYR